MIHMPDYNNYNNSFRQRKQQDRKVEPLISSSPSPSETKKAGFFEDLIKETGLYLWNTVIKNSLLKLVDGIITGAKDKILWNGNVQQGSNYTDYSKSNSASRSYDNRARAAGRLRYDQVPIPTRDKAIEILDEMYKHITKYDDVSVADLYVMLNQPTYFPDNNYVWRSMRGADARQIPGGQWVLVLPEPEVLRL